MQWCRDQGATVRTRPWTGNVCAGGEGNVHYSYSMNLKGSREVGLGSAHVKAMATGTHAANVNCHSSILLLQAGTRVCTGRTYWPEVQSLHEQVPRHRLLFNHHICSHGGAPWRACQCACSCVPQCAPAGERPRRCWAVLAAGRRLRLEFKPAICMDSP